MPRTKKERCIECRPECTLFKPLGKTIKSGEVITLELDEYEAIRLADIEGLKMEEAAQKMGISAPTFYRILSGAHKKVADALINVKAIQICNN
jgi:predicted DNA-binding protein (UPF0251 family)